ncbi:MAG: hypothetical protein C4547_13635 [Phycisphaerales bacterium]|nr:MAG: hypothetical protein C4547_13635 [Phycisphaerales bacterium]
MKHGWIWVLIGACVFGAPAGPIAAQDPIAYVWDNDDGQPIQNRSWCKQDNWNPKGTPGSIDSATIPELDQNHQYPIFDCEDPGTIASLTIDANSNSHVELTFQNSGDPRVLIIEDRDGLNILGDNSDVLIRNNGVLQLNGGGVATIGGTIRFDNAETTAPKFVLGDGSNLTIKGDGNSTVTFVAAYRTLITGQVAAPDDAEVLVLSSDVRMCGSFDIDVLLVNNGRVQTAVDCGLDPGEREKPGTINLICHPKGGSGYWLVDGGKGTGSGEESKLNVDTGLASTGNLLIWKYGWAIFSRPGTFVRDTFWDGSPNDSGHLMVRRGGTLRVRKNLAFDAHRWDVKCVPSE